MPRINNWQRHVGFTGSRLPPQDVQVAGIRDVLAYLWSQKCDWLHHGDCVGADASAHEVARAIGMRVWGHPPELPEFRAYCTFDKTNPEKAYLRRNIDMVRDTKILVAAPSQPVEVTRSGTWTTVRHARKLCRTVFIVYPNGNITRER